MRDKCTVIAMTSLVLGLLTSVVDVYSPTFPVWVLSNDDFDFEGSHFEVKSGDASVTCDYWSPWHYMYGGSGYIYSGSGSGYFGMSNYWYTDEGELDGGTYATLRFECDYTESGDSAGTSSAFIRAYFFVYREQNGGWTYVGGDDVTEQTSWTSSSLHDLTVTHNFDSSRYKFRFLCRAEFSSPSVTCQIGNVEVNNGTTSCSRWLKVFGA